MRKFFILLAALGLIATACGGDDSAASCEGIADDAIQVIQDVIDELDEMTDALLEAGQDKFIVGMADWHPGGDCIAAFRDPQNLAIDMLTHLDEVKALFDTVGPGGGWILSSSNSIDSGADPANVVAMGRAIGRCRYQ